MKGLEKQLKSLQRDYRVLQDAHEILQQRLEKVRTADDLRDEQLAALRRQLKVAETRAETGTTAPS